MDKAARAALLTAKGMDKKFSSMDDLLAASRESIARKNKMTADLAAHGKPVMFTMANGRKAMAGPDMSKPEGFRLTYLDQEGAPTGHFEFPALHMAIRQALDEQFEPVGKSTGGALDTKSENIADYVADLLRQGRAKEVTDDLMAQADPQRLHQHYTSGNTGMDLPMDYASRMERAKQMGFDVNSRSYRGDENPNLNAFKTGQFAREKIGVTSSSSPKVAATYMRGDSPAMYPIFSRSKNPLEVNAGGRNWSGIPAEADTNLGNLHHVLRPEDYLDENNLADHILGRVADWGDGEKTKLAVSNTNHVSRAAQDAGFDQIKFQNIVDRGGADRFHTGPANDPHTTIMTADPANIRSQFARFDPRLEHLAHLSASTGGAMEFARHVEAVHRAGGQIAPSKYLPNVPRAVHAGGGKVVNLGKEKFVRSIIKAVADVKSGAHQENMDRRAYKLHESGHLPLPIGTKVTPPQGWDMPSELHIHGYWQDILHPDQHGYKLKSENGDVYEVQHQMHSGQNPYVFGGGFKAYSGPIRNRAGYSDEAMASKNPILPTRNTEQSDQLNKEYDQLFGNGPDITKAAGGRIHANGGGKMDLRSKAAQVIRNQPQEKGNVDQMLAMMTAKGVKPSELLNAGRPFGHSVSKEEMAQHFEDAVPKVQVQRNDGLRAGSSPTRYNNYTLPGGEKYREHLLHLGDVQEQKQKLKENLYERWEKAKASGDTETADQIVSKYYSLGNYDVDPNFQSNHWSIPNVIAHVRMKDRDNGKTLHVEEVQSDWGQKGREKGFYDPVKPIEVFHTGTGQTVHATNNLKDAKDKAEELGPEYDYAYQDEDKVPQGPYVGNTQHWTDLAIKHALTEAAKGGHNRVVFSPGEANADLYDQRRPITEADLASDPNNSEILGHLHTYDSNSRKQNAPIKVKDEAHLAKLLGRDHAKDILAEPLSNLSSTGMKSRFISGPNMNLGGHGMVDYYNNIVHPAALKLLRQHDPSIQPESYDLPNGYKGFSLPMTDKARQSILDNGFQAFKDGGMVGDDDDDGITAYHGSPHSFDKFDISKIGTGEGNQSYGHGLYFAGNENVAKYYRDALTDAEQTPLHFDQRPIDTPWNEEIRARWPEHFSGKSQRDQDAMEEALGNLSQVNNLKDVPNALSNMSAAAKYMYQRHIKPKLTKPDLGKGHMYKVKINAKPEELLDWDKPVSEQHPNVIQHIEKFFPEGIPSVKKYGEVVKGGDLYQMMLDRAGGIMHRKKIDDAGVPTRLFGGTSERLSKYLYGVGIKGIRYRDAGSRDLSDGDPTHNYVMFHHDPVQVVDKYEYGGTVAVPKARDVSAALALTRRFTKDGNGATLALKSKGK